MSRVPAAVDVGDVDLNNIESIGSAESVVGSRARREATDHGHAFDGDEIGVLDLALEEAHEEVEGVEGDGREDPRLSVRSVVGQSGEEADKREEADRRTAS